MSACKKCGREWDEPEMPTRGDWESSRKWVYESDAIGRIKAFAKKMAAGELVAVPPNVNFNAYTVVVRERDEARAEVAKLKSTLSLANDSRIECEARLAALKLAAEWNPSRDSKIATLTEEMDRLKAALDAERSAAASHLAALEVVAKDRDGVRAHIKSIVHAVRMELENSALAHDRAKRALGGPW